MYADKVIVIGNGSSVLNEKKGEIIDKFKDVVRFNNYIVRGYEDYIGSKTTIWARNNSNRTKERKNEDFEQIIITNPPRDFSSVKNYQSAMELYNKLPNAVMIDENLKSCLQIDLKLKGSCKCSNRNKNIRLGDVWGWVSAGLMVIAHFVENYKNPIYIYGFDNFEKKDGHPRHYYNNEEPLPTSVMHKGDREKQWIQRRIDSGKIRVL